MRSLNRFFFNLAFGVALCSLANIAANAQMTTLTAPNNPLGTLVSGYGNDAWFGGRGDNFLVTSDTTINSVGLFADLTGITLNYEVGSIPALGGSGVDGKTILRSGSSLTSTSGLEFVDFGFSDLTLLAGNNYYVEFNYAGTPNQELYYFNQNISWTQGPFSNIDGFAVDANGQGNFVAPVVRLGVGSSVAATPEPGAFALLAGVAFCGAGVALKHRSKRRA